MVVTKPFDSSKWEQDPDGNWHRKSAAGRIAAWVVLAVLLVAGITTFFALRGADDAVGGADQAVFPSTAPELFDYLEGAGLECPVPAAGPDEDLRVCGEPGNDATVFVRASGGGVVEVTIQSAWLKTLGGDPVSVLDALGKSLGWTNAASRRMVEARAVDGTTEAGNVSWVFDPDEGLRIMVG